MKRLISLLTLLIVGNFIHAEKRALIIAIGNYPKASGIKPIHSSNDIPILRNTFLAQGFDSSNITVLKDSMATKAGILKAFDTLLGKINAGDQVIVDFSSHGQRIQGNRGDEIDGFDEAIVCYDAFIEMTPTYHGEAHLRDYEIENILHDLRKKAGRDGNVLMLFDACHSGSMTRGVDDVRGIASDFITDPSTLNRGNTSAGREEEGFGVTGYKIVERDETDLAPYVVFCASLANQVDSETADKTRNVRVGPLNYAFTKAVPCLNERSTYSDLFGRIMVEMNSFKWSQTPLMLGNAGNRKIFNGEFVAPESFIKVKSVSTNDTGVIIAGTFTGINKGTKINFYLSSDQDKKKPYTTAVVVADDNFFSTVVFDKTMNIVDSFNYQVLQGKVVDRTFGDQRLMAHVSANMPITLRSFLNKYALIKVVPDTAVADIMISRDGDKYSVYQASSGDLIKGDIILPPGDTGFTSITKAVAGYAQCRMVKQLKLDNFLILTDVDINVIGKKDSLLQGNGTKVKQILNVQAGKDSLAITVTNVGSKTVYVNILDISPDGSITPVFPNEEMDPKDYCLLPTTHFTSHFGVSPPYGKEFLKIILTEDDINLSTVLNTAGRSGSTRGVHSAVEQLFRQTFNIADTRGVVSPMSGLDNASTYDFTFNIVKP